MRNVKLISGIIYALSIGVFVFGAVWSFFGITPFERIGYMLVVSAFGFVGSLVRVSKEDDKTRQKIMRRTFYVLFFLYLLLFTFLVFFDSFFSENRGDDLDQRVNLIPFKSTSSLLYGLKKRWISVSKPLINFGGNLLLCMPFALFLPLLFKRQHNFYLFFITVLGVSVMVESVQFLAKRGFCDVDDLIYNVCGACLLFGLLHIKPIRKLVKKIIKLEY